MKKKILQILSILFNDLIILFTIYSMTQFWFMHGEGNMEVYGITHLRYFTNLSNYFVAIAAGCMIVETAKQLANPDYQVKKWVYKLKFMSTVSVTVTFLTVVVFLGPTQGFDIMFAGVCIFLHLLTPLLAIISMLFFEREHQISKQEALLGLWPTFLYSIVYSVLVLTRVWPDFYGFTFGFQYELIPLSLIGMYLLTIGISYLEQFLKERIQK